ncbi:hypothetical protein L345_17067, partial [Ophiophagus hannah]
MQRIELPVEPPHLPQHIPADARVRLQYLGASRCMQDPEAAADPCKGGIRCRDLPGTAAGREPRHGQGCDPREDSQPPAGSNRDPRPWPLGCRGLCHREGAAS